MSNPSFVCVAEKSRAVFRLWLCFLLLASCALAQDSNGCGYRIDASPVSALLDPNDGFDMRSSLTNDGSDVISMVERRSRETIPKNAWSLYTRALRADREGARAQAEILALAAVALAPNFFEAHAALATSYLKDLKLEAASREIDTVQQLDPSYLAGQELLGILVFLRGDTETAEGIFIKVLANGPRRPSAHYFLARILSEQNHCEVALAHFKTAQGLRRHPPQPVLDIEPYPTPVGE